MGNGHCHHQFFINKRPTLILGENLCSGAFAKKLWQFGSGGEGQPIAAQLKNKRLACEATEFELCSLCLRDIPFIVFSQKIRLWIEKSFNL